MRRCTVTVMAEPSVKYSGAAGLPRMTWKSTPSAPMFARNGAWTANFGSLSHRPQPLTPQRVWTTASATAEGTGSPCPIS